MLKRIILTPNNMKDPLVSVVIPTCNREEMLKRALASVQAQTFSDFEVIVVDDGAGTSAMLPVSDPRFRYIKNTQKKGGAGSRNVGIQSAKGEYVAFLDDDDMWMPEKLFITLDALQRASEKAVFVYTSVTNQYENRKEVTEAPEGEVNQLERALRKFNGFLTSTLVVKKNAFNEVGGFDESLPSHQEPDLIIRISQKYDGVGINMPLTCMTMTPREHIGGSLERRIMGRTMLLDKHKTLFEARPKVLAYHLFRIGLWQRDMGRQKDAKSSFKKALMVSPHPKYLLHYLSLSFGGAPYKVFGKREKN